MVKKRDHDAVIELLQSLLKVVSKRRNATAILRAWEMELKGINPLTALLVDSEGEYLYNDGLVFGWR